MIIWLASYPRSGNTFFRILLNQRYGIKTYSVYNDPLFDKLQGSSDVVGHHKLEMSYEKMIASEQIFFVKTHDLPSDNFPAIYLVRDGRDSLVSYAHYLKSFQQKSFKRSCQEKIKSLLGWDEYYEILKNLIISSHKNYGGWSENVEQWMIRDRLTHLIKFEDLITDPFNQIESAIEALNIQNDFPQKNDNVPSFEELHSKWPQFFRKGQTGEWKQKMDRELQDIFWKHHSKVMQQLGYKQ
jgi:hypothetical protein